jgi:ribosomal protein S25
MNNINFISVLDNDECAAKIGAMIAKELKLRKKYGRYNLVNGTKTNIGLARTVFNILTEEFEKSKKV